MRFVLSLAVTCLALGVGGAQSARAQYPVYAPQTPVYAPQVPVYAPQTPVYASPGYGYGGGRSHHSHHSHHCAPSTPQYYSGYGAPVVQYPPSGGYAPVYGANPIYAQPVPPPSSVVYSSNNYYGVQPVQTRHPWHPGHYLLGN